MIYAFDLAQLKKTHTQQMRTLEYSKKHLTQSTNRFASFWRLVLKSFVVEYPFYNVYQAAQCL